MGDVSQQPSDDDYDRHLILAAEEGRISRVQHWLRRGADINAKDEDGWTALHKACWWSHYNIVQFLIDHGANIHASNNRGETPLHTMNYNEFFEDAPPSDPEIVKLLIKNGADPNGWSQYDGTPFYNACLLNNFEVAKYMIDHGGADVNARDDKGKTLLMIALVEEDPEFSDDTFSFLIENGADLYARDNNGKTVLELAIDRLDLDAVNLLIPYLGAGGINSKYESGMAPLHQACNRGHLAIVKSLIENGANVHIKDNDGATPLHYACKQRHLPIVKSLIENGANVDIKDNDGATPLHYACNNYGWRCEAIVKSLIENGANVHVEDKDGETPLHYACKQCHLAIVKSLIKNGANVDIKDNDGATPLHYACNNYECKAIVKKLLVKPGAADACKRRKLVAVKLLVKHGANVDFKDKDGNTPLHVASKNGLLPVVQFLLSRGANVNVETSLGFTPLHLAARGNHPNVVWFLLSQHPLLISERSD